MRCMQQCRPLVHLSCYPYRVQLGCWAIAWYQCGESRAKGRERPVSPDCRLAPGCYGAAGCHSPWQSIAADKGSSCMGCIGSELARNTCRHGRERRKRGASAEGGVAAGRSCAAGCRPWRRRRSCRLRGETRRRMRRSPAGCSSSSTERPLQLPGAARGSSPPSTLHR